MLLRLCASMVLLDIRREALHGEKTLTHLVLKFMDGLVKLGALINFESHLYLPFVLLKMSAKYN